MKKSRYFVAGDGYTWNQTHHVKVVGNDVYLVPLKGTVNKDNSFRMGGIMEKVKLGYWKEVTEEELVLV